MDSYEDAASRGMGATPNRMRLEITTNANDSKEPLLEQEPFVMDVSGGEVFTVVIDE